MGFGCHVFGAEGFVRGADKGYRRELTMLSPISSAVPPQAVSHAVPSAPAAAPAAVAASTAAPVDKVSISPQGAAQHDGDGDGH